MDTVFILGILIAGWLIFMPVLGLLAFLRSNQFSHEVDLLKRELAALRRKVEDGGISGSMPEPEIPPLSETPFQSKQPSLSKTSGETFRAPVAAIAEPRLPVAPTQTKKAERERNDWERLIAANWMIWLGGIALAIGGLFLVALAIEVGVFGPLVRTLAAGALGVLLIGASFRARQIPLIKTAADQVRNLPAILSGAGVITLYGACVAAGALYHFVPPVFALAMMAGVSVIAILLAYRLGQVMAVLGFIGAYLSPFFTGADGGSVTALLPYIAILTAAALTLVRLSGWRVLTWLGLAGTTLWAFIALADAGATGQWAVCAFVLATGVTALILGQEAAFKAWVTPQTLHAPLGSLYKSGETLIAAHLQWLLTGAVIFLADFESIGDSAPGIGLVLFAGLGLLGAALRPGFVLLAPIGAGAILGSLVLWSSFPLSIGLACLLAGLAYGVIGTGLMQWTSQKATFALIAALMPAVTLFIAFWRHNAFELGFEWGLISLFIACALGFILDYLKRQDPGFSKYPMTAAFYALGIVLSAALAPFLVFGGFVLGTAIAFVALGFAIITARFDLPILRLAAPITVALTIGLLVRPGMFRGVEIASTPIANELTLYFGLAIGALIAGAWFLSGRSRLVQTYQGGAIILGFSLLGLTIRHIAGDGALYGPFAGLGEASGYAIAYLGMAASLAWRFNKQHIVWRGAEYIALAIGAGGLLVAFANSTEGLRSNILLFNLLLPAFAMPACLLSVYAAILRRSQRTELAIWAGWAAMLLGFAWVTLEVSRIVYMEGRDLLWLYSAGWIIYAFALLFWGVWKHRATARYASLGILLVAVGKVFLFDMASLDGLARAGSFIGLGAALIGIALFYQRYVFSLSGRGDRA